MRSQRHFVTMLSGFIFAAISAHQLAAFFGGGAEKNEPDGTVDVFVDDQEVVDADGGTSGGDHGTVCGNLVGPDVVVGDIYGIQNYPLMINTTDAFSLGTEACNIGNHNLDWYDTDNRHPVIGQNMFRLKNGRFEQIGQSWVKHGFAAAQLNGCGCGCQPNGGVWTNLGVGCSDPYDASTNGYQPGLGPKFEVNAHTGVFAYPFTGEDQDGNVIYKRLQVAPADLSAAQNPGALYFVEAQYVHPGDAAAGNQDNNASYRPIVITGTPNEFNAMLTGETQREHPAIHAWRFSDPSVTETDVRVPNEGLMILAAKATDLGGGVWHYEYALQNLNSDRSAGSFSVPVAQSAIVQNMGFHDVNYHSGEPFSPADWAPTTASAAVTWSTTPFEVNTNSNALRWGTLYNFRFDVNLAPGTGPVTIGLFKPGTPASVTVMTVVPDPTANDCNFNALPDYCDVSCSAHGGECNVPGCGLSAECNGNGIPDECDVVSGISNDCDGDMIPDECEADFDGDGDVDSCDHDPDNDGVLGSADVCQFTPLGSLVQSNGAQVGDADWDCDIDLSDYWPLSACLTSSGPGLPAGMMCRMRFDADGNTRIDLRDAAYFQRWFSGE